MHQRGRSSSSATSQQGAQRRGRDGHHRDRCRRSSGSATSRVTCYHALAGDPEHALDHFEQAIAGDPRVREWAASDSDLDSLRDDPRFAAITASRE